MRHTHREAGRQRAQERDTERDRDRETERERQRKPLSGGTLRYSVSLVAKHNCFVFFEKNYKHMIFIIVPLFEPL